MANRMAWAARANRCIRAADAWGPAFASEIARPRRRDQIRPMAGLDAVPLKRLSQQCEMGRLSSSYLQNNEF